MALNIHAIYNQIFRIWRKKRLQWFLKKLGPVPTDVMLDVGGYPWCWTAQKQFVARVDALNIHEVPSPTLTGTSQGVSCLVGDGCALAFKDASYDIGYSNSVIEHVGSWENQQKFASEIRRVARGIWVQTPAYECPIEPHYMAPFIHYFPGELRRKVVRWMTPWGWITRPGRAEIDLMVNTTRLLRRSEMEQLFPDCEIITERMLGFIPKSYIAFRRKDDRRLC